jgi:nucleoside-diphosphate-sugar epimerase
LPGDVQLRLEGGKNLLHAGRAAGVRRYIQQSSAFFLKSDSILADESSGFAVDACSTVGLCARTYQELESRLLISQIPEVVALRYGFFYGPTTWYCSDGAVGEQVRNQQVAIIGGGHSVWSFVHIEDAARGTVAAVTAEPGTYNLVDDNPSPVSVWLPAFANSIGANPPPEVSEQTALQSIGEAGVYYGTRLQGATNAKAKSILGFQPRRLEWL